MSLVAEFRKTKQSFGATTNTVMTRAANKQLAERLADRELTDEEIAAIDINVNTAATDFDNIKSAILEQGQEVPTGTPTAQYGALIKDIDADKYAQGYTAGIEDGRQAERDDFWNAYQDYGNRTDYEGAFRGAVWTDETLKPAYAIKPTKASYMFSYSAITTMNIKDINIDLSETPRTAYLFDYCKKLVNVGELDISNGQGNNIFYYCTALESVEKLIVSSTMSFNQAFWMCSSLTDITFEGVIGQNISISQSPLKRESILSIIECLIDNTSSGTTRQLTIGSANKAQLTDDEIQSVADKGWTLS